eukprot:TRINITY_DN13065_c0_g1_i1.p1 TRINITY_DN13065_c0_g1~~TRINITY_DN13065_c0_g1_i1.p1  ORF type:complete len:260 (+),score=20.82 TRINITY_DN13065_c0_g1_i1:122-901(+)
MTSKSRKRTQSRREGEANVSEPPKQEKPKQPAPISMSPKIPSPQQPQQQEDSDEEGEGKAHLGKNKRPDLIGTRPCERFLNGHCNFGKDCWFVHDVEAREQAKAAATHLSPNSGIQLKLGEGLPDDPPKPKISLAPTNPWGRKPDDEYSDESPMEQSPSGESSQDYVGHAVPNDLMNHMNLEANDGAAAARFSGQAERQNRSVCDSSLPPATPSTNPALGVFSVVDMLANARSSLFEDAISRGVQGVSCSPSSLHERTA